MSNAGSFAVERLGVGDWPDTDATVAEPVVVESELDGWLVHWEFEDQEGSLALVGLQIVRPVEIPLGGLTMRTLRKLTMGDEVRREAWRRLA